MHYLLRISSAMTAAIALVAFVPAAGAQEVSKNTCQVVGLDSPPQPLGDREGHGISVGTETCRVDSGVMAGGLVTGQDIWEWDKTNATLVSVSGIVSKPGAIAAYQITEGKLALTMTDGKVTGFTGSGKGHWPVAGGSAASLAGKSFTYTVKSTGPGQWETEVTAN